MRKVMVVLIAALLLAPMLASINLEVKGESISNFSPELPFVPSRPKVESKPWWETTSMDMDRNKIFDYLDDKLADGRYDNYHIFI